MEIICREQHLGLKANVITAWQPAAAAADLSTTCDDDTKNPNSTNTTQYALFLEDDLEVSPFFLRFARDAIIHYGGLSLSSSSSSPLSSSSEQQQQQQQQQEGLLGVSLFHELFSEVLHDYVDVAVHEDCDDCGGDSCSSSSSSSGTARIRKHRSNNVPSLYIYQQAQSWGAVFFPKEWRRFLEYYNNLPADFNPKLPFDTFINDWNPRTSWKKFLMCYMYDQGRYMIYPNLKHRFSFSQLQLYY